MTTAPTKTFESDNYSAHQVNGLWACYNHELGIDVFVFDPPMRSDEHLCRKFCNHMNEEYETRTAASTL
jgi:hypothetical protein